MNNQQKQQIIEQLNTANNVLIAVRVNPSVDELAAAIGLTLALNKLEKHATTVFSGVVPSTLEFLQPEQTIEATTDSLRDFIIALDKAKADKLRYKVEDDVVRIFITPYKASLSDKDLQFSQGDFNVDLVVALGVSHREDLDAAITAHGRILHDATVVSVTNKQDDAELGSIHWQEAQASSVCEMVAAMTLELQSDILDGQMATAFLTGIVAETDRFKNELTTPMSLSLSAQLMSFGANQQLIAEKLEEPIVEAVHEEEAELLSIAHDTTEPQTDHDVHHDEDAHIDALLSQEASTDSQDAPNEDSIAADGSLQIAHHPSETAHQSSAIGDTAEAMLPEAELPESTIQEPDYKNFGPAPVVPPYQPPQLQYEELSQPATTPQPLQPETIQAEGVDLQLDEQTGTDAVAEVVLPPAPVLESEPPHVEIEDGAEVQDFSNPAFFAPPASPLPPVDQQFDAQMTPAREEFGALDTLQVPENPSAEAMTAAAYVPPAIETPLTHEPVVAPLATTEVPQEPQDTPFDLRDQLPLATDVPQAAENIDALRDSVAKAADAMPTAFPARQMSIAATPLELQDEMQLRQQSEATVQEQTQVEDTLPPPPPVPPPMMPQFYAPPQDPNSQS